jgi:hypothetical protein
MIAGMVAVLFLGGLVLVAQTMDESKVAESSEVGSHKLLVDAFPKIVPRLGYLPAQFIR